MADFIKKIDTSQGPKQYDFQSLGNFPKAEVGQILRVKSVDNNGNPTEWESVDSTKVRTAVIGISWVEDEDTGVKSQFVAIEGVDTNNTASVDHVYIGDKSSESFATFVEEENQFLTLITNGYAATVNGDITFHIFGETNTVTIPILVEVV